ncbi:hypothetical protein AVEN_236935-1 [Araneus ventricosus]|uniref:Uncharacterized protein n=1 Tax=Araneus ventricosus TaxID=182803 RepID=A0A4Y2NSQ8_ARAVE|nr:hypothetical protein AVEN_236935-1 [Araneus ventricosus]
MSVSPDSTMLPWNLAGGAKLRNQLVVFNPPTPRGPQNLTTFPYGGSVDIWIGEMDSSALSPNYGWSKAHWGVNSWESLGSLIGF